LVKVKNLNGTSDKDRKCSCKSWLDHWNKNRYLNKAYKAGYCRACKSRENLVGGHVKKVQHSDCKEYIVPICSRCNNQKDKTFEVNEHDLIRAVECEK